MAVKTVKLFKHAAPKNNNSQQRIPGAYNSKQTVRYCYKFLQTPLPPIITLQAWHAAFNFTSKLPHALLVRHTAFT